MNEKVDRKRRKKLKEGASGRVGDRNEKENKRG